MKTVKAFVIINFIGLIFFSIGSIWGLVSMGQEQVGLIELIGIFFYFFSFLFFAGLFVWNCTIIVSVFKYRDHSRYLLRNSIIILVIGVILPALYLLVILYFSFINRP